jgi:hypothetical protein
MAEDAYERPTRGEQRTNDLMHAFAASGVDVRDISGHEPTEFSNWSIEANAPADDAAVDALCAVATEHGFRLDIVDGAEPGRVAVVFEGDGR